MYEIKYGPLDMYNNYCGLMVESVNTTGPVLMMTLTGLEEYVEYNVTVRAYTSEGAGPYGNPPITERTLEDGKETLLSLSDPTLYVPQFQLSHHRMYQPLLYHPLRLRSRGRKSLIVIRME